MNQLPLFLVVLAGIILTIGDIILKEWVTTSYKSFYWTGIAFYLISMNLLAHSYKYENIAIASLLMVLFNVITLTLVSYFIFKEPLSLYEFSGIILGIMAIILLEIGKI